MSAGDRDMLAAVLAEHRYTYDQWMQEGQFWVKCECGEKLACGPENLSGLAHRTHAADVLLASDWLREHDRATYAHGYHHGYKDAAYDHDAAVYGDQDEYLRDRAERAAANEYRTTEDSSKMSP